MSILISVTVILACLLFWGVTVKLGMKKLTCSRSFSAPAVFEGEEGELIEVVRNDRPFIIPWLRIESRISPHLQIGRQDNLEVSGEMYYCSLFTMMPHQQIRRMHHVRFLHRGAYDLGNASLTIGDLLGMFRTQRTQNLSAPVLVYPRLLPEDQIPSPLSKMLGDLVRRPQLLQDPFLIRGIRPYQPGDPVRDIHWPATARTGEVQLRVRDYSARTKLLVILNIQDDDIQWANRPAEQYEAAVERSISLAATLALRALHSGLSAGFASNMPLLGSKEPLVMLPQEGAAREEALLSAFARLDLVRVQFFPAFLDSLSKCSGMDMLILSRYDSGSIQASVRNLERRGNQVVFHLLEGGAQ